MPNLSTITPFEAYVHARDVLKRRWEEAEPVIMTDPYSAYSYASDVLKRRWKKAEPVIMTDPYHAYLYARDVLKRRWEEAEPVIMTDPSSACWYAIDVLKRRWEEAEPAMMTEPESACYYAFNVLNRRWKKAEPVIKASIYWDEYVEHFNIEGVNAIGKVHKLTREQIDNTGAYIGDVDLDNFDGDIELAPNLMAFSTGDLRASGSIRSGEGTDIFCFNLIAGGDLYVAGSARVYEEVVVQGNAEIVGNLSVGDAVGIVGKTLVHGRLTINDQSAERKEKEKEGAATMSKDKLADLLSRSPFLLQAIKQVNPNEVITYQSLLSQLDKVGLEILKTSKARSPSRFTEWFKSVFIPKYLRAFRWLVLGLSCLVGVGYVLN